LGTLYPILGSFKAQYGLARIVRSLSSMNHPLSSSALHDEALNQNSDGTAMAAA
jgi:hypothetical protein